jgi:hypothetical protein
MYVRGNPVMLVDPNGMSDRKPKKGKKPKANRKWFKHKKRRMGSGQKLIWRHKGSSKSPNQRVAHARGKLPKIKTGNYNTSDWQPEGTGTNGYNMHNLTRNPGQDYLRSLKVTGNHNNGLKGTLFTNKNGFPIDGIITYQGPWSISGNWQFAGYLPFIGNSLLNFSNILLASNMFIRDPKLLPMTLVSSLLYVANSSRINPLFRNTYNVNISRIGGSYTLEARFREFNLYNTTNNKRPYWHSWWYGL